MSKENYTEISKLCSQYSVEENFIFELNEIGLVNIETIEKYQCIHQDELSNLEKIIRIHKDLSVNIEGIDIILTLLRKINAFQDKLNAVENRLKLYEGTQ